MTGRRTPQVMDASFLRCALISHPKYAMVLRPRWDTIGAVPASHETRFERHGFTDAVFGQAVRTQFPTGQGFHRKRCIL